MGSLTAKVTPLSPSCRLYPPGRGPMRDGVEPEAGVKSKPDPPCQDSLLIQNVPYLAG